MRLLLLPILIAFTLPLRAAPAPAPDANSILAAAQASAQKLKTTAVSYQVRVSGRALSDAVIHVLQAPDGRRRLIFCKSTLGFQSELARLIERDNLWYATEGQRHVKYRPFEACFERVEIPEFRELAELQALASPTGLRTARLRSVTGNLASYSVPIDDPKPLQQLTEKLRAFLKTNPNVAVKTQLDRIQTLLDHGTQITVDTETGMLARLELIDITVSISDVKWLERIPEDQLAVASQEWEDRTADPTAADPDDLVMIAHDGHWRPGGAERSIDGELLNLKTGLTRRIPYAGAASLPGCFAKDRKSVFVSGWSVIDGTFGLYQIDLKSGVNRQLGGPALATGATLMCALSPDGATLACLHKDAAAGILESQVYLIDIATGHAKPIGKPFDTAFLSWMPDGKGLFLITRKYPDMNKPSVDTVCRMSLDGAITPLFQGSNPLRLANSNTLIFHNNEQPHRWFTCDLDGKNPQPLADGLPKYGFPASSPDGKFILFMHFTDDKGPIPTLLELGDTQATPIQVGPGLWSWPAWN
jgi:hypothetical protein